jgi:hypothetical protein
VQRRRGGGGVVDGGATYFVGGEAAFSNDGVTGYSDAGLLHKKI